MFGAAAVALLLTMCAWGLQVVFAFHCPLGLCHVVACRFELPYSRVCVANEDSGMKRMLVTVLNNFKVCLINTYPR